MNCIIENKKICFYDIDYEYRKYLSTIDDKVNLKQGRRFVGIIVGIGDYQYFIPLTSKPLRANGKRRNPRTTVEIFNESNELIAALLINNMIPVPRGCYTYIEFNNDQYKDYLNSEYIYLKKDSTIKEIERKTTNTYRDVVDRKDSFMINFCTNFELLQKECDKWK